MSATTIRILIADDHPLFRDGISAALGAEEGVCVVGEAGDGAQAVELHRGLRPDVTLMDMQMPVMNGIDAIRAIRAECPPARIIVLTTFDGDVLALRAIRAGAAGYLLKSTVRRDLVDVIRLVHAGKLHIPADIASRMATCHTDDLLSDREVDVLQLVAAGLSNKGIGEMLSIAEETVKSHMKSILGKLDVKDRTLAVTVAIKRGILAP